MSKLDPEDQGTAKGLAEDLGRASRVIQDTIRGYEYYEAETRRLKAELQEAKEEFERERKAWHITAGWLNGPLAPTGREIRNAKAEALRNAAAYLDESTQADVNNYIGRPQPTFSHTERYADVQWLRQRALDIQMGRIDE